MASMDRNQHGLTELQEAFCVAYVYYCNMNGTEAVKQVYNFGDSEDNRNVIRYKKKLLNNPLVRRRINELVTERNEHLVVDRLWVIEKLKTMAEGASSEQAKLRALELLGKSMDLFKETHVVERGDSPRDIIKKSIERREQKTQIEDSSQSQPFCSTGLCSVDKQFIAEMEKGGGDVDSQTKFDA